MNADPRQARWNGRRLGLMAVLLIALAIFVAWRASQFAPSGQPSLANAPGSGPPPGASGLHQGAEPVDAPASGRTLVGRPIIQRILNYGSAEGEPGMIHQNGQTPVGPEAFAIGKDGNILVADVVNQRVLVYSASGAYLHTINTPGTTLGDVMADGKGRVYVYDQARHSLQRYDTDGTLRSTLSLDPEDIGTRGYFHVVGDSIYFANAAARDVRVATVQEGVLMVPDASVERTTDGIHGESGRSYSMSLVRGQALRLQVRDPGTPYAAQNLEIPMPGIVSARYAGEDRAKQFYVQTERLAGGRIVLEVLTFSSTGQQLATTRMPQNDYFIWTSKLVDIEPDGTIVQFLPEQNQAQLSLLAN